MSIIGIEGIHVTAPVGVYEWEKEQGRDFVVDIHLEMDIDFLKLEDHIDHTINYEEIHKIVKEVMTRSFNLVETLVKEIYDAIMIEFPMLNSVRIKVRKLKPVRGENLDAVYVETLFVK